jgi:hypothetical protein
VFVFVFCSLCVFLLFQNQITFYYDFMRNTKCLPPCSQLSPRLSHFFVSDRNALAKKNRNRVEWTNVACDSYSCCSQSQLRWIKNFQHQELVKPQTCTHTGCNGYEITVWVLQGCNHFWIWSRVWDALPETHFHSILQKTIFEKTSWFQKMLDVACKLFQFENSFYWNTGNMHWNT